MKEARIKYPGLFRLTYITTLMKNFWLDRAKARKGQEALKEKEKFIYPKQLWHYVIKALGNRKRP